MYIDVSNYLPLLLPILLNLFLIVLRRVYLNAPYKRWIIGYSLYFLFRLLYLIAIPYFVVTSYFQWIMELPFLLLDFCTYVNASKKFSLLLKGRCEEAKWHSTPQEYKRKRRITKIFSLTRKLLLFYFRICL